MGKLGRGVATLVLLAVAALTGCGRDPAPTASSPSPTPSAATPATVWDVAATLRTSVNMSALDHSPTEGAWGCCVLSEEWFDQVAAAGFTAVRLPVRFSAHMGADAPYAIDPAFLDRVQWAVDQITARGMAVIVDNHHWGVEGAADYDQLFNDPASQRDRFLAIWAQVGPRFADYGPDVVFEVLNEPHGNLDAVWNEYQADALAVIRESNPTRAVILSPGGWGSAAGLATLEIPDDPNVIVTFHHYEPFAFTHQGATWVDPVPPVGVTWDGGGLSVATGWQEWTWDTDTEVDDAGLAVRFTAPWAGLAYHALSPVSGATAVTFTTDADVTLRVHCAPGGDAADAPALVHAKAGVPVSVAVGDCSDGRVGAGEDLQNLWLQSGEKVQGEWTLTSLAVVTDAGEVRPLADGLAAVRGPIDLAIAFGDAHGVPMFLGEFGSSDLADQASRLAWTRELRTYAVSHGIGTAYWSLQGGFGLVDDATHAYYEDLLTAATAER